MIQNCRYSCGSHHWRSAMGFWVQTLCLFVIAIPVFGNDKIDYALVSLADENKVSLFELNKSSATMELVEDFEIGGDAGSQYFDSRRSVLYLGLRNSGKIAALKFNRDKKSLRPICVVKVDKDPAYLHLDRSGHWLFSAYYATGRIACHPVLDSGEIGKKAQWVMTAPKAHAILPDATNRFVFVPHTGPDAIFQFRFNEKTGTLEPNEPAQLKFKKGTGPRHIVAHPEHRSVFFSINEQGSSLSELRMDVDSGILRDIKTESTLDVPNQTPNACADLEISNNGKFIYGANRGHDSISLFHFSGSNGIQRVAIFKTEKTPRQFSLSPDNRFLIAAGQSTDKLAIFRVNPHHGHLTRVGTQKTGRKPWWITIVD